MPKRDFDEPNTLRPAPPPLPGVNLYITHCVHGLDMRIFPRCYLCKPFGTVQGDYPMPFIPRSAMGTTTGTEGSFTVRCTCPPNRGDNYLGTCPIHDVQVTYT